MKVFVTGGTGFVGGHLLKSLLTEGHTVRLLVRRKKDGGEPGVEQVVGDVTERGSIMEAAAGCDAVIHLVGIIREFPAKGITFDALHVAGTRNVVDGAKAAGIRRYLHMSALGTRSGASSAYHRTKFAAEEYVRASGLDYTIFRPSIIFGPGDDFINRLAGYIRSYPAVPVIGDGEYRLQPISVEDVARCYKEALRMPQTIGNTYELCGKDRFSYNDLLDVIARALGRGKVRKLPAPLAVMKGIVPFLQKLPSFPITTDQIAMLVEENICDGSWRTTFFFEPQSFEEGIKKYLHP